MSRAVDKYGINIRNAALQTELANLGINANVQALSQADKAMLRTIVILNSSEYAWGDLSNTLGFPANQLRVLKNQFSMLGRAIGNIFLPIVAKVLPYLNQLVYALRSLAEWIVRLLGYEDFNWGNATGADNSAISDMLDDTGGIADNVADTSDSMGKAADNAKKFKNQLQGFDKLNVLTTNDASDASGGGGGSGSGVGGIDSGLLDAALDDALSRYQEKWDEAYANMEQSFSTFADNVKKAFKEGGLYGVGSYFAETITNGLNIIPWDTVKTKAEEAGTAIADFLNGLTNPELFAAAGTAFSEGINTVFSFLDGFVSEYDFEELGASIAEGLNDANAKIDWETIFDFAGKLGEKLADFVNGIVTDTNWEKAGETIANTLTAITRTIQNFLDGVDFAEVGKGFGDIFNGLLDYDWESLGNSVSAAINGVFSTLKNFLQTAEWSELGSDLLTAVKTALSGISWSDITGTTSGLTAALFDFVSGAVSSIDWQTLPADIFNAIVDALSGFDVAGVEHSLGNLAGNLLKAFFDLDAGLVDLFKGIPIKITEYFVSEIEAAGWDSNADLMQNGMALIQGVLNGIIDAIKGIGSWIINNVTKPFFDGFLEAFGTNTDEIIGIGTNIIQGLFDGIIGAITGVGDWIMTNIFKPFVNNFKELFGIHSPSTVFSEFGGMLIEGLFNGIIDALSNIGTWVKEHILEPISGAITVASDWFLETGKAIWDGITGEFGKVSETISVTVTAVKDSALDVVQGIWVTLVDKTSTLTAVAKNTASKVLSTLKSGWETVKNQTSTLAATAINKAGSVLSTLKEGWETVKKKSVTLAATAVNKASGVLSTLKSGWQTVKDKAATLSATAINKAKTVLSTLKSGWQTIVGKSVTLAATAVNKASGVLSTLKSGWQTIVAKSVTLKATAKNAASGVLKTLKDGWSSITTKAVTLTARFQDFFSAPLKEAWNAIAGGINKGIDVINKIPKVNIPKAPTLATGGFIPNGGGSIKRYAVGGFPDMGTLFFAGEAGAEIVGNTTRGTEVLNQSQIAQAMAESMESANAQQNAYIRQQNELLRQQNRLLSAILEKTGITEGEIFSAVRNVDGNFKRVNGHSAFAY